MLAVGWLSIHIHIVRRIIYGPVGSVDLENSIHSTSTPGGVLIARYMRNGEVRTGVFEEVD
ncbi:hypothetical protein N234_23830 [Ralstonia pickettii DTP0602]|nr:hypothetical protein N234_23830 [Ralstonia pickettii DTP0602]